MIGLVVDISLVCQLLGCFCVGNCIKVHSRILLDSFNHGDSLERLAEIKLDISIHELGCTQHLLCHVSEHILSQVHHTVIIGICLI